MSTRGAWGFRLNETDRIAYRRSDAYPACLGQQVAELAAWPEERQRRIASELKPVPADRLSHKEWQQSQRDLLSAGRQPDGREFLLEGTFCEWAYIINLDSGMLEVYRANRLTSSPGRYAAGADTAGVSLWLEIPLQELRPQPGLFIIRVREAYSEPGNSSGSVPG